MDLASALNNQVLSHCCLAWQMQFPLINAAVSLGWAAGLPVGISFVISNCHVSSTFLDYSG